MLIFHSRFLVMVPQGMFEAICEACPRLKKLKMSFDGRLDSNYYDDLVAIIYHEETYVIPVMSELRSLRY